MKSSCPAASTAARAARARGLAHRGAVRPPAFDVVHQISTLSVYSFYDQSFAGAAAPRHSTCVRLEHEVVVRAAGGLGVGSVRTVLAGG